MGQAVGGARVRVEERGKDLVTSSRGEFWRLLTPGLFVGLIVCLFLLVCVCLFVCLLLGNLASSSRWVGWNLKLVVATKASIEF